MSINIIHARLGNAALLYFLLMGLWGLIQFLRKKDVDPAYRGALIIGEIFLLSIASIGSFLWLSGLRPARGIHMIYGLFSPTIMPIIYAVTKGCSTRLELLGYSTSCFILAAMVMRAVFTASHVL